MEMRSFSFLSIYLSRVIVHHVCHIPCSRKNETEQRPSKINKSMNVLEKNCLINNSNSVGMFVLVYSMVSYFKSAFVFILVCQNAWIYALHIIWWHLYLLVLVWKISQSRITHGAGELISKHTIALFHHSVGYRTLYFTCFWIGSNLLRNELPDSSWQ